MKIRTMEIIKRIIIDSQHMIYALDELNNHIFHYTTLHEEVSHDLLSAIHYLDKANDILSKCYTATTGITSKDLSNENWADYSVNKYIDKE